MLGLPLAREHGERKVIVKGDSKLVAIPARRNFQLPDEVGGERSLAELRPAAPS